MKYTRRQTLALLGGLAAGAVACGSPSNRGVSVAADDAPAPPPTDTAPPATTTAAKTDVVPTKKGAGTSAPALTLHGVDGVAVLDAYGTVLQPLPATARIAEDGAVAVAAVATPDGTTEVTWYDLAEVGAVTQSTVPGAAELAAISFDGRTAALFARSAAGATFDPAAGDHTAVIVVDESGELWRRTYPRDLLPEAIGTLNTPGDVVAAIETLHGEPIEGVDPYRVVMLDATSFDVGIPFNLLEKSQPLDEKMAGFSRQQVASPSNQLLFTLYRGVEDGGRQYAFVHTLFTVGGVYCLLLPDEMELGELEGSLAVSPDERRLWVVSPNGTTATFDIENLLGGGVSPTVGSVPIGKQRLDDHPALVVTRAGMWVGTSDGAVSTDGRTMASPGPVSSLVAAPADLGAPEDALMAVVDSSLLLFDIDAKPALVAELPFDGRLRALRP